MRLVLRRELIRIPWVLFVGPTLRFSGGAPRRPLQPVVRLHIVVSKRVVLLSQLSRRSETAALIHERTADVMRYSRPQRSFPSAAR